MINIDDHKNCPECKADWDGGDILEYFKKTRDEKSSPYYADKTDEELMEVAALYGYSEENKRRFQEGVYGLEIQEAYDGVLYWVCQTCKTHWHRFNGKKYSEEEINKKTDHSKWESD